MKTYRMILIPILKNDHYSLVVVKMAENMLHYLDSIRASRERSQAPNIFKRFMERYCQERGDRRNFKVIVRRDVPHQTNYRDCGVFLCQYAEREVRGGRHDYTQRMMPQIRLKMIWEILNGSLKKTVKIVSRKEEVHMQRGDANHHREDAGLRVGKGISKNKKEGEGEKERSKEKVDCSKASSSKVVRGS